jgi:hypothetical protein
LELRKSAVYGLEELILHCADEQVNAVLGKLDGLINVIDAVNNNTENDMREIDQMKGWYLYIIGCIAQRVEVRLKSYATRIFSVLYPMLSSEELSIHEDILKVLGHIVDALGINFIEFLEGFKDYLLFSLNKLDAPGMVTGGLRLLSSIIIGADVRFKNYVPFYTDVVLTLLDNPEFPEIAVPDAFTVLGDMGLIGEEHFHSYLIKTMKLFYHACGTKINPNSADNIEHVNNLNIALFSAYNCIMKGMERLRKDEYKQFLDFQIAHAEVLISNDRAINDRAKDNFNLVVPEFSLEMPPALQQVIGEFIFYTLTIYGRDIIEKFNNELFINFALKKQKLFNFSLIGKFKDCGVIIKK